MFKYALPLLIVISLYSSVVSAAEHVSEIETLYSYSEYGGGDVVFTIKVKDVTCYGYWVDPNYGGSKAVYSTLLSAFHASTSVALTVDATVKWPGSTNYYCKLIRVGLSK